jgi:hypothetical protein
MTSTHERAGSKAPPSPGDEPTAGPERRVLWFGEHTDDLLGAELGLSPDELAALRADGVIG